MLPPGYYWGVSFKKSIRKNSSVNQFTLNKMILLLCLILLAYTTIFPDSLTDIMSNFMSDLTFIQLVLRIAIFLPIILPLIFIALYEPTELDEKEDLAKGNFYLTDTKLIALWNLDLKPTNRLQRNPKISEAQLKIVEKMQDPFHKDDKSENFWETFCDTSIQQSSFELKLLRIINSLISLS